MDKLVLWQRYQNWLYYHKGLNLYLDISRISFDDGFVEALENKFQKAFDDMEALENGAIANPDEKRSVGHYWLRAPQLAPTEEFKNQIVNVLEGIDTFVKNIHTGKIKPPTKEKFTNVISVGIGGSALGPEFVAEALGRSFPLMSIDFVDNLDPDGIDKVLSKLQPVLESTLVLSISKSGGTQETRIGTLEVEKFYQKQGLNFSNYAVAVTMPGSKLDRHAIDQGWLARFAMLDWVGGRTSELSAVGLLPAALQGIDIHEMLSGAREMDIATRNRNLKENPSALLALSWYFATNGKGEKDMVVLPYKDSLLLFSRYLQQLVMESLGKKLDLDGNVVHQGIAVYGNKGSTDQHAYVQQLREGVPNFFITFIEVLKDRLGKSFEVEPGITSGDYLSGFLQGTRSALFESQRESITITIPEVNPRIVGALIALYERAVGLYGFLININAYHQPGVEAGKKAAATILELQQKVLSVLQTSIDPLNLESIALKAGAQDDIETIFWIVRHLEANERGIEIKGDRAHPSDLQIFLNQS